MATNMATNPTATDHYRRHGYTILRNVFNPMEIASLRDECRVKGKSVYIGPRDFNGLLLSEKLIEPLRLFLGPRLVIFGDSSSKSDDKVADWSSRHFHIDARGDDFDYTQPYPLLRIGIYMQDHDVYSGGLKLRPGSWTRFCVEQYGMRRLIKKAIRERSMGQLRPPPSSINLDARAGDVALWNLRTHHTYRLRDTSAARPTTFLSPVCGESYSAGLSLSRTKQSLHYLCDLRGTVHIPGPIREKSLAYP